MKYCNFYLYRILKEEEACLKKYIQAYGIQLSSSSEMTGKAEMR